MIHHFKKIPTAQAKRDKNEKDIIETVSKYLGALCIENSSGDVPDWTIVYRGRVMFWEIKNPQTVGEYKNPSKMLSDGQAALREEIEARNGEYYVVTSKDQAIKILTQGGR